MKMLGYAAGAGGGVLMIGVLVVALAIGGGVPEPELAAGSCAILPENAPTTAAILDNTTDPTAVPGSETSAAQTISEGDSGYDIPQTTATLTADQMGHARTIVGVGKGMAITQRGAAIALATAQQESTLNPLAMSPSGTWVGLFQQGGELYALINRNDPVATSRAFYEQLLARVPDYDNNDPATGWRIADAAQTVQESGAGAQFYAQWQDWALTLAAALYNGTGALSTNSIQCTPAPLGGPVPVTGQGVAVELPPAAGYTGTVTAPNNNVATAIKAALSYLGTDYAWGGGNSTGPTLGIHDGGAGDRHGDYQKVGFDCSGLMLYAYAQAGISLPHGSWLQAQTGTSHPYTEAVPGDLLFWGGDDIHHVAMFLGVFNGLELMVESPQSGMTVRVTTVRTGGDFNHTAVRLL